MDINEFRTYGHRLIDQLAEYLETVEDEPLFPRVESEALFQAFDEPLPQDSETLETILSDLDEKLLPYCAQVNHPGYFGLITPSPTPVGILGDLIASALNQNLGAYSIGPSAVELERRTVRWLCDLVGYDTGAGGNLTSGGTMANFIGLKLARDYASRNRTQHEGIRDQMAAYTSEERHVSVDKAVDAVGIGRENLRILPTDDDFRIRIDALEEAIRQDRARGIRATCIIAMGGSTNTGAVDGLADLRRIADCEGMWLHVDAAYGGGMLLSRTRPDVLTDLSLADSVTMDPHKWFFAPLDAGAILVRDELQLTRSFGMQPAYLTDQLDVRSERYNYYVHGFEQSRRFRSLKVWMAFKRYGARQLGEWVDANVKHANRLYELATAHADFQVAKRPEMSVVCIRYIGGTISDRDRIQLHATVARRVEEGGKYWISTTALKGHTWFRICPVNFRTRMEHMEGLFDLLVTECENADRQLSSSSSLHPIT